MSPIGVAVHAADPITRLSLAAYVRQQSGLILRTGGETGDTHVVVVAVERMNVSALDLLKQLSAKFPASGVLVIVGQEWEVDPQAAVAESVRSCE
ncbi:MAG: hypothetical protein JF597_29220 [Streptomyces sp.]|uniref:hypothetical protein n=1 Tax=Streptomyces sp. TaxID=1931 RepID=UPI0025EC784B|nr:hypothetical protein [Streptomyces sp.]MBW8797512.1 hypothetical protein [Streptomyces sp.]